MSRAEGVASLTEWFEWVGGSLDDQLTVPLLVTIPHSGERVPPEASWLQSVSSLELLTDVDRFVNLLYTPALEKNRVPGLVTHVHRYAVDLNRYPEDVDAESVIGSVHAAGQFTKGFHWVQTTLGGRLMAKPISAADHRLLVERYHDEFHRQIGLRLSQLVAAFSNVSIYHLDLHSMPSVGTGAHADQGKRRAGIVLSDCRGQSASATFRDLVWDALKSAGFEVAYNDPYQGGRITQRYGQPSRRHETLQVEINRALYMNERTKEMLPCFASVQAQLSRVMDQVVANLR